MTRSCHLFLPTRQKPSTVSTVWICTPPHARNIGLTYRLHLVLKHHCPLHMLLAVEESVSLLGTVHLCLLRLCLCLCTRCQGTLTLDI